jgi:iron complex outermembrane recepter protein
MSVVWSMHIAGENSAKREGDTIRHKPDVKGGFMGFTGKWSVLAGASLAALMASAGMAETEAPQAPAASATQDIIVTAQKREQKIQDVPIAISAFSGKTLDAMKIETGGDLLKSIPNVTFSKNNFTGYNFSIRGIGTKAVAVSTDPGVAVAYNSSTLITNRLFEQEFYDIERVEVLRGPQGTLYGRNATAGVVNIISHKADLDKLDGFFKVESGSYLTRRLSGAVNVPIIDDKLAIRAAGAYTKRNGYDVNDLYGNKIDGRDLWSTRLTVSAKPIDRLHIDLVWEHFNENDDRQRAGKQLCHKDDGPAEVDGNPLTQDQQDSLSQGCKDGSLYDNGAYGTPDGRSLNAYQAYNFLTFGNGLLHNEDGTIVDPYGNIAQSHDLRHFSSVINPAYRAKADVLEANATLDLGKVSVVSQTVYDRDIFSSSEDYNRYASVPIFADTSQTTFGFPGDNVSPGGVFTDPQLGASNLFVASDLVRSRSHQFSQEIRFQSNDPSSRLQYVVGANYTKFRNSTDYNVFINTLTASELNSGSLIPLLCGGAITAGVAQPGCPYVDPNKAGVGPADGHNYFRSVNPYHLTSWGAFGDANYALTPHFKLIAGIRENRDQKSFNQVPSQLLLSTSPLLSGFADQGYPTVGVINQQFNKITGRAGFQWTPVVPFTDSSMIYFTYSRGYKAGGANPPGVGFGSADGGFGADSFSNSPSQLATTFKPEFVNSFELGIKNTALGGKLTFNATGFFYDYKNYQVSQIIDRSSQNENFNATIWGLEFETVYNPFRNLSLNANLGYERSRIGGGQQSIDVMDRTDGHPGYYVVKPFVQLPSNCVVAQAVIDKAINDGDPFYSICQGAGGGFSIPSLADPSQYPGNPTLDQLYPNQGRGFYKDVSHHELPNTPHLTLNVGAQYTIPLGDWALIARADYYRQSSSWARVYNDPIDRLRGWDNTNFSLRLGNQKLGLLAEFYVKNAFNKTPITDAFINSDDTGLTTNVFTLDPRIFGVNLTKSF